MKTLGWKAEREHPSREYAAAWHAILLWSAEWHRRSITGVELSADAVCRQAVERAKHARINVDSLTSDGRAVDELTEQALADCGADEPEPADLRGLADDSACGVFPVRYAEAAEREIDRFIRESEGGSGEIA